MAEIPSWLTQRVDAVKTKLAAADCKCEIMLSPAPLWVGVYAKIEAPSLSFAAGAALTVLQDIGKDKLVKVHVMPCGEESKDFMYDKTEYRGCVRFSIAPDEDRAIG